MKNDVRIKFYSHEATEITSADKVALLAIGEGVLLIMKDDTNYYYNLTDIMMYTVREKEDSE